MNEKLQRNNVRYNVLVTYYALTLIYVAFVIVSINIIYPEYELLTAISILLITATYFTTTIIFIIFNIVFSSTNTTERNVISSERTRDRGYVPLARFVA